MSEPDPDSVKPWYLRNLTQALALDETTGNVYLRTGISGDVIIEGNVAIPRSRARKNGYRLLGDRGVWN